MADPNRFGGEPLLLPIENQCADATGRPRSGREFLRSRRPSPFNNSMQNLYPIAIVILEPLMFQDDDRRGCGRIPSSIAGESSRPASMKQEGSGIPKSGSGNAFRRDVASPEIGVKSLRRCVAERIAISPRSWQNGAWVSISVSQVAIPGMEPPLRRVGPGYDGEGGSMETTVILR